MTRKLVRKNVFHFKLEIIIIDNQRLSSVYKFYGKLAIISNSFKYRLECEAFATGQFSAGQVDRFYSDQS